MQILRAAEDYLEAMLMMQQKHGYIRSIDIAEQLGVTKPSVTYTTKRLRENGYITMDRDGLITLTPSGMDIASRMLDRHHTLTKFLMELGVDAKTAEEEGFLALAAQFEGVAKIEKTHEERYLKLLDNLKKGEVFKKGEKVMWFCRNCGHVEIAESAPAVCPVCKHPQAYFQVKAENY